MLTCQVIRREVTTKSGKTYTKAPKIQRYVANASRSCCRDTDFLRLVTPLRLQRKRHLRSLKKRRTEAQKETISEYKAKLAQHAEERKVQHQAVRAAKKAKRSA